MSETVGIITYTITVEEAVTVEMIDDLLVAAFEGGSNTWLGSVSVIAPYRGEFASDHLANGGCLYVYDGSGTRYYLGRQMFLSALREYCEMKQQSPTEVYENHDAAVADSILQIALFGMEVYG